MAMHSGPVKERIKVLFRQCLSREPDQDELDRLERFFHAQRTRFERKDLNAATIAGPGGDGNEARDRAAWTVMVRVLLNLDEAVTKG